VTFPWQLTLHSPPSDRSRNSSFRQGTPLQSSDSLISFGHLEVWTSWQLRQAIFRLVAVLPVLVWPAM
jgi:hypothetical protein